MIDWHVIWIALAALAVIVLPLTARAALNARHNHKLEEGSYEQSEAPEAAGPPYPDDHYPASPAHVLQDQSDSPEGGPAGMGLSQPADLGNADGQALEGAMAAAHVHELAGLTAGETVTEEIDRLEARLRVLYELQAAELAADQDRVDWALESGYLARPHWIAGISNDDFQAAEILGMDWRPAVRMVGR